MANSTEEFLIVCNGPRTASKTTDFSLERLKKIERFMEAVLSLHGASLGDPCPRDCAACLIRDRMEALAAHEAISKEEPKKDSVRFGIGPGSIRFGIGPPGLVK